MHPCGMRAGGCIAKCGIGTSENETYAQREPGISQVVPFVAIQNIFELALKKPKNVHFRALQYASTTASSTIKMQCTHTHRQLNLAAASQRPACSPSNDDWHQYRILLLLQHIYMCGQSTYRHHRQSILSLSKSTHQTPQQHLVLVLPLLQQTTCNHPTSTTHGNCHMHRQPAHTHQNSCTEMYSTTIRCAVASTRSCSPFKHACCS